MFNNYFCRFKQTLTKLVLEFNNIGSKGTQYLADAIQNNKVDNILYVFYLVFI